MQSDGSRCTFIEKEFAMICIFLVTMLFVLSFTNMQWGLEF